MSGCTCLEVIMGPIPGSSGDITVDCSQKLVGVLAASRTSYKGQDKGQLYYSRCRAHLRALQEVGRNRSRTVRHRAKTYAISPGPSSAALLQHRWIGSLPGARRVAEVRRKQP